MRRPLASFLAGVVLLTACSGPISQTTTEAPESASVASKPTAAAKPEAEPTDPAATPESEPGEDWYPDQEMGDLRAEDFDQITDEAWTLLLQDPEFHIGNRYVLYGRINSQRPFTGFERFFLDLAISHQEMDEEDEGVLAAGVADFYTDISDITNLDQFLLYVEITGHHDYSQVGGFARAPKFQVHRLVDL